MIKKVSFLALLLLVIGVVGSIVTFSSLNNKVNVSEVQPIESGQITSLKIDTIATDVELITIQNEDEAGVRFMVSGFVELQSFAMTWINSMERIFLRRLSANSSLPMRFIRYSRTSMRKR